MLGVERLDLAVVVSPDPDYAEYVSMGPRHYLDRFVDEFHLTSDDVRDKVVTRPTVGVGGAPAKDEYLVHESLLRSSSEFACAGDAEAVEFCREIVEEMVTELGVPRAEAVARINRHWSEPDPGGRVPRVWIVGLDIAYHEEPAHWARGIYYGPESHWWRPGATPEPLPPPR